MSIRRSSGEFMLDESHVNIYEGGPDCAEEVAYFVRRNVFLEDGKLHLRAKKEDYIGYRDFHYTSGKVTTRSKFTIKYGTIEGKMKVPKGNGYFNSFWMLPANGSWPPEIDIFEILGRDPCKVYMTNHWKRWFTKPYVQGKTMNQGSFTGPDFSADFHIFKLEWIPGQLRWLIDGVERHRSINKVPDQPMFLIAEAQIGGGTWPGYPDDTTVFPQDLIVDYVKVYPY